MQTPSTRIRLGAVALGSSAFLLAVFPLIRPFFPLDVFEAERTIAAAGPGGWGMLSRDPWFLRRFSKANT